MFTEVSNLFTKFHRKYIFVVDIIISICQDNLDYCECIFVKKL